MTHPPHPRAGEAPCRECGQPLAADQRYCVMCGARRTNARPDALAHLLDRAAAARAAKQSQVAAAVDHTGTQRRVAVGASGAAAGESAAAAGVASGGGASGRAAFERRRRAALPVALATLVGFVVVTGARVPDTLAGPATQSLSVVLPAPAPPAPAPEPAPAPVPAPPPPVEEPVDDVAADPLPPPEPAPLPVEEAPAPVDEPPEETTSDPPPAAEEPPASPIQHVFLVVLGDTDVAALAGDETAAPYLAGTLKPSGTLLTDYRTVADGALANGVALVSGQGPTRQTLADCPEHGDVRPADPLADGQVGGDGCVYGYETGTIGDQLRGLGKEWRAYVEPAADAPSADAAPPAGRGDACGGPDATRRNPFLAFHGVIDDPEECARRNAGLDQLDRDLANPDRTPALAYITSAAPAGSAGADAFLERVVPRILNSTAYATGGLIVVLGDQPPAPATEPAPTPPAPPTATEPTPPPPAPPITTTPPPAPAPPAPPSPDPVPPTTTESAPEPPPTTDPQPRAAAAAARPPYPATYPNVGDAAAAGAGRPVGALLISPFTPAGRTDRTPASHFTLLRTLADAFGVDPLGYAATDDVRPLPRRLFAVAP